MWVRDWHWLLADASPVFEVRWPDGEDRDGLAALMVQDPVVYEDLGEVDRSSYVSQVLPAFGTGAPMSDSGVLAWGPHEIAFAEGDPHDGQLVLTTTELLAYWADPVPGFVHLRHADFDAACGADGIDFAGAWRQVTLDGGGVRRFGSGRFGFHPLLGSDAQANRRTLSVLLSLAMRLEPIG